MIPFPHNDYLYFFHINKDSLYYLALRVRMGDVYMTNASTVYLLFNWSNSDRLFPVQCFLHVLETYTA